MHLFEGFPDHMNVANVSEDDLAVRIGGVRATVLVPTALQLVCASVEQRPGIVDFNEASLVVGRAITYAYLPDKLFITPIPRAKQERTWLTTAPNRRARHFIIEAKCWQPI